jgi:exopolyphosphatase/guanosine-5'-triphosphate,3'-diphosphate pyrophosphatase
VLGTTSPVAAASMDVGCVRLTERHLHDDPPTPDQVAAASADVLAALDAVAKVVPFGRTATLVGLAGSVTTVTAHALDLDEYDPEVIDGTVLPVDRVLASSRDLITMSRARRARLPFMHPGRVDVIGAGALVWSDAITRVRADVGATGGALRTVVTSEHDILDGIALNAAGC